MIDINNFEEIRPFLDSEVSEAITRFTSKEIFPLISAKVFPGMDKEAVSQHLKNVNSLYDFQSKIIYPILKKITTESTDGISHTGIDKINANKPHLYISNHHDILLDPSILNMVLFEHGINTTQVAIGDNLVQEDWIKDLSRLNRSFIVFRSPPIKESLDYTLQLSNYIRHVILGLNESIWIAQREGRAKDGNDITQVSLLKMLAFTEKEDKLEYLKRLNFMPIAMSYEYDPCDILKVKELIAKEQEKSYQKSAGEDLVSMVTGLMGKKGRIHISVGTTLNNEFDNIMLNDSPKEQFISLAACIDEQIQSIIKLWPNNFIAYDMLIGKDLNTEQYTPEEKSIFKDYIESRLSTSNLVDDDARIKLLTLYANRVKNKIRLTEF